MDPFPGLKQRHCFTLLEREVTWFELVSLQTLQNMEVPVTPLPLNQRKDSCTSRSSEILMQIMSWESTLKPSSQSLRWFIIIPWIDCPSKELNTCPWGILFCINCFDSKASSMTWTSKERLNQNEKTRAFMTRLSNEATTSCDCNYNLLSNRLHLSLIQLRWTCLCSQRQTCFHRHFFIMQTPSRWCFQL